MYNKILVAIDVFREKNAEKLCKTANDMAKMNGAAVRLVSVVPDYGMPLVATYFPKDAQDKVKSEMSAMLKKYATEYIDDNVSAILRQGKRARNIVDEATEWGADLVIIGCRKKASRDNIRMLGACSSSVADRVDCSVIVVR
ncbi:MAG: universal stress protein [Methylococcales bacterium]